MVVKLLPEPLNGVGQRRVRREEVEHHAACSAPGGSSSGRERFREHCHDLVVCTKSWHASRGEVHSWLVYLAKAPLAGCSPLISHLFPTEGET